MPSNEYKSSVSEDEDVDERFVKAAGDEYEQEAEADGAAVAHETDAEAESKSNIKQEYPDHEADNPLIDNYHEEIHQLLQSVAEATQKQLLNQPRPQEESDDAEKDFDDRQVKDIPYTAEDDNDNTDIDTGYSAARPRKKRKTKLLSKILEPKARSVPSSTRRSSHSFLRSGKLTGLSVPSRHKGKVRRVSKESSKRMASYHVTATYVETVNLTQFEQHASSALKRPSDNIFVDAFKRSITELATYYDHTIDKFLLPIKAQQIPTLLKPYTSPSLSRNRGTSLKNISSKSSRVQQIDVVKSNDQNHNRKDFESNLIEQQAVEVLSIGTKRGRERPRGSSRRKVLVPIKETSGIQEPPVQEDGLVKGKGRGRGRERARGRGRGRPMKVNSAYDEVRVTAKRKGGQGREEETHKAQEPTEAFEQEEEKVDVLDGCILCSDKYFSTEGFDDKTILMCDRCDREFHVGCLRDKGIANITALPKDHWFCSPFCSRSYQTLHDYLEKGPTEVKQRLLKPHHKGKLIRWCVIHGARQDGNTQGYIKDCGRIFKECFEPLRFQDSKKDMVPYLLNRGEDPKHNYTGMHAAILIVNSIAVSAALFRIFTEEIAELPLIATRIRQQRKGYFQILFACIEDFFREIGIKNLVLPAADTVAQSWKEKLNFTELSQAQMEAYSKLIPILIFAESVMLIKPLISQADQSP